MLVFPFPIQCHSLSLSLSFSHSLIIIQMFPLSLPLLPINIWSLPFVEEACRAVKPSPVCLSVFFYSLSFPFPYSFQPTTTTTTTTTIVWSPRFTQKHNALSDGTTTTTTTTTTAAIITFFLFQLSVHWALPLFFLFFSRSAAVTLRALLLYKYYSAVDWEEK